MDILVGMSVFLTTFLFASTELGYFLKTTAKLQKYNLDLLSAVNTIHTLQQGQLGHDSTVIFQPFEPGISKATISNSTYHFDCLVTQ